MNLVVTPRDLSTARFLLFFTDTGYWQGAVSLGAVAVVILLLAGKKRMAVFFIGAVSTSYLAFTVAKQVLHRARPGAGYSLIPQGGAGVGLLFWRIFGKD